MNKRQEHYDKVESILKSCKNILHLKTAVDIINQFTKQHRVGENDKEYIYLKQLLGLMKNKIKDRGDETIDEDLSPSGKEFKAVSSLIPSLAGIKYEQDELENIRTQELVNDIGDEAKINSTIPTGNPVKGNGNSGPVRVQGTNVNVKTGKGVIEQDEIEGGVADDMTPEDLAKKHNVRLKDIVDEIKVGKKIEKEHTVSDELAKEIAMDHIKEFPDYYTDDEHGVKASEKGLEGDLEESSTAGGSGSFVGALSGAPIKREMPNSVPPVSDAGGMNTPIGKIRSFKKSQIKESNVFSKKDILESTDGSSIGVYDSPGGWGNNKFMGTKGKRGNAVQRKGNGHKVTYKGNGKNLSTFVKVKDKCKTFPYCVQGSNAIELSKTPFKEGVKDMSTTKEKIKEGWYKFSDAAKREGRETTIAAGVLKKVLLKQEVSEDEYRFLKEQSIDIAKIFGVLTMGAVSTALPLLLEKLLNKKGISVMPTENKPIEESSVELIESICKETGKSKKYVHSLIDKYL